MLLYCTTLPQALPQQLDPKYRNPCWTDQYNRFRCLPYFQIVGKFMMLRMQGFGAALT